MPSKASGAAGMPVLVKKIGREMPVNRHLMPFHATAAFDASQQTFSRISDRFFNRQR